MDKMICPVTLSDHVEIIEEIEVSKICQLYKNALGIDVQTNFHNLTRLQKVKSLDTGYVFFCPDDVAGGEELYYQLEQFDWYYLSQKWEYFEALRYIDTKNSVLEIGSGDGSFLSLLKSNNYAHVTGLELNTKAIARATIKGLTTINETIEQYAMRMPLQADVVCMFQVLEHISKVNSFITSSLNALKSGGKLIVSVPNNDSFIKNDEENALNLPPHHMGQWNTESLTNLTTCFPIKLQKILYEPLQAYHVKWFAAVYLKKLVGNRIFYRLLDKSMVMGWVEKIFNRKRKNIKGHSIIAVYQKL